MTRDRCDIILPTCGQGGLVKDCVESLIRHTKYPYRLIVIDDGAPPEIALYLDGRAGSGCLDMAVVRPAEKLGWIRAVNTGLERSKDSKYVCIQNDDTVFTEGWCDELVKVLGADPEIGIANPEWEMPEGSGIDAFAASLRQYSGRTIDTDYCRGHSFFIRREVIDRIGGFDTVYLPAYYDDRDYSLRAIAAGYRCVRARGAFVYHVRNATFSKTVAPDAVRAMMERNGAIFYARWGMPLRVVFVLEKTADTGPGLRDICMDQNKVVVITGAGRTVPYEHTNMSVVRFGRGFVGPGALAMIAVRRSRKAQKGIDFIFTDSRLFSGVAGALKALITAEVVFEEDPARLFAAARSFINEKKSWKKGMAS